MWILSIGQSEIYAPFSALCTMEFYLYWAQVPLMRMRIIFFSLYYTSFFSNSGLFTGCKNDGCVVNFKLYFYVLMLLLHRSGGCCCRVLVVYIPLMGKFLERTGFSGKGGLICCCCCGDHNLSIRLCGHMIVRTKFGLI